MQLVTIKEIFKMQGLQ